MDYPADSYGNEWNFNVFTNTMEDAYRKRLEDLNKEYSWLDDGGCDVSEMMKIGMMDCRMARDSKQVVHEHCPPIVGDSPGVIDRLGSDGLREEVAGDMTIDRCDGRLMARDSKQVVPEHCLPVVVDSLGAIDRLGSDGLREEVAGDTTIDRCDVAGIAGLSENPDGTVYLIVFGNERVMVDHEGAIPGERVDGGCVASVRRLGERLIGSQFRGAKRFGQYFHAGQLNFVYIVPSLECGGCEDQKWRPLNDALLGCGGDHALKFLLGAFPRLKLLKVHWSKLLDYDQIEIITKRLKLIGATEIQVARAILHRGPRRREGLAWHLRLFGFPGLKKSLTRWIATKKNGTKKKPKSGICGDNNVIMLDNLFYHDEIFKGTRFDTDAEGWTQCLLDNPGHHVCFGNDPFPVKEIVDIVNLCPLHTEEELCCRKWITGRVDLSIMRACGHGPCCDKYCRGPCDKHDCSEPITRFDRCDFSYLKYCGGKRSSDPTNFINNVDPMQWMADNKQEMEKRELDANGLYGLLYGGHSTDGAF